MNLSDKLLIDLIFFGVACGLYLQYRGVAAMKRLPAVADRKKRGLSRSETLMLLESAGYLFGGAFFEVLSISNALAHGVLS